MHTRERNGNLFLFLLGVFFFFPTSVAFGASYVFSPASGNFEVGKNFTVRLLVNTGGSAVNTGDATITYDASVLTAVSVSKDGSPFNLWVTDPVISGNTITFAGGATSPLAGSPAIITITFRGRAQGTANVEVTKGTLLAGAGTNVLSGSTGATFTITPASEAPPADEPEQRPTQQRVVVVPPPDAPTIKSATHPDEDEWYNTSAARFSWDIPYGVLGVRFVFSKDKHATTTTLHEPPIGEWSRDSIEDGTWYFIAEYRNRGGWGSSTVFQINVDTTPPEPFELVAVGGDLTAELRFNARDTLSGVSVYRVAVDGGRARDVQPSELVSGGYRIANLDPGERTFSVTAVDRAGNEQTAHATATVTGTRAVQDDGGVKTSGFGAIYWVSLLFTGALAIVITMLVQERRRFHEEKDHIKRETMEIGDRLVNIFGVLRDEIEEKVIELSHKPNMTDNERNILEGLKDALDVSEELIDKEVEDVRKLLK